MAGGRGWAQQLAVLWGDRHPELGEVPSVALGRRCALALSAGRVAKPGRKLDPNEDAVLAITGADGHLLVVADGHYGFDAARGALLAIAAAAASAPRQAAAEPEGFVRALLAAARDGVGEALQTADEERQGSRTALTVALVMGRHVHLATAGDTSAAQVGSRSGRWDVAAAPYLGPGSPLPTGRRLRIRKAAPLVLASDGLVNFLGAAWQTSAAEIIDAASDPRDAAAALVRAACDRGAGDNVAVAVLAGPHDRLPEQPAHGFRSVAESDDLQVILPPPTDATVE